MSSESFPAKRTYSLADLCEMFGFTARQIHDFRAKGALQPPDGKGRGARYSDEHVQRLGAIKPLLENGISVARIAARYIPPSATRSLGDLPAPPVSERWDRVRIGPDLEISFLVRGNLDRRRAQLIALMSREARRLLAALAVSADLETSHRADDLVSHPEGFNS